MNYQETIQFLFSQLPVYQRDGAAAYKNNLDNTILLDNHFNHPHRKFKTIHIAGTNGKGSVSHMLASVLQCAGYKTGLYTSPHMKDFRERIRVNGEMVSETFVTEFVRENNEIIEKIKPSFFEMSVAMAFEYFAYKRVDIAVIETGMGGRLDSTNIISPELSVITNISFDHMQFLGDTLKKIAIEKAGIIKENTPVIIGRSDTETDPVFEKSANEKNSFLFYADRLYRADRKDNNSGKYQEYNIYRNYEEYFPGLMTDMLGNYQEENLPVVFMSLEILNQKGFMITEQAIIDGLKEVQPNTGLKGRWQTIHEKPTVITDTAHNEDGIKKVFSQLMRMRFEKLIIVFGMVNDKDHSRILRLLPLDAVYIFTKASIPRALNENELMKLAKECGLKGIACPTVKESYEIALKMASENDLIYIGGSTFVSSEVV